MNYIKLFENFENDFNEIRATLRELSYALTDDDLDVSIPREVNKEGKFRLLILKNDFNDEIDVSNHIRDIEVLINYLNVNKFKLVSINIYPMENTCDECKIILTDNNRFGGVHSPYYKCPECKEIKTHTDLTNHQILTAQDLKSYNSTAINYIGLTFKNE